MFLFQKQFENLLAYSTKHWRAEGNNSEIFHDFMTKMYTLVYFITI